MASTPNDIVSVAEGKFKTLPKEHQLRYLNQHASKEAFAIFAEMGTGKTWMALLNAADLWASGDLSHLLVIAPNGVHLNWIVEMEKHFPSYVRYIAAAWDASPNKAERLAIENLYSAVANGQLRAFTMNWEALQTKKGVAAAERFLLSARSAMIVCDESIRMKNPKAQRTKALMKLKRLSKYRRIMDGHPVGNSPFDLFSQFSFLDEHILGTTSYAAFKAEYADMLSDDNPLLKYIKQRSGTSHNPQVVATGPDGKPAYKNLDKLKALIAPFYYRVLKKDCLDLPPKVYKSVMFKLTKEQKEIYKQAKELLRLEYKDIEVPFNKLVAMGKLAQITSGYYLHPLSDGEPVRIEGENPKLDILKDRVEEIVTAGNKVIIWARYRVEIADIVKTIESLGIKCVQYHGGVASKDRQGIIEEFERGDAQVFIGNQRAGGTGITLVAASYVLYYSNDFSITDRLQSEDRAHRIGQTKTVTYVNIAAKGTIDEAIIRALTMKEEISDDIMGDDMINQLWQEHVLN